MSDYIDILLSALEEELYSHLGKDYFLASQREDQAADALRATLSADQNDLFGPRCPPTRTTCSTPTNPPGTTPPAPIRTPTPAGPSSWPGPSTVRPPRRTAPRCCCR